MAYFRHTLMLSLHLVLAVLVSSENQPDTNYTECGTQKFVLLKALFETDGNLYELDRIFSPPYDATSRYIKVEYTFADSRGDYGDCNATYIWAIGGFLLMQPPGIFQYTSLLVGNPANSLEEMHLKLPYACRSLIDETNDGGCSCHNPYDVGQYLQILTKQINQYSKYTNPVSVVLDLESGAQAVCTDHMKETEYFNSDTRVYFIFAMLIPAIVMTILAIFIRSEHRTIYNKLARPGTGYHTLAGVTLASVHVLLFVLVMDVLAVHRYHYDLYELSESDVRDFINIFSPVITLSLDLLVTLQLVLFMLYLCCAELHREGCPLGRCLNTGLFCLVVPFLYVMLGKSDIQCMIQELGSKDDQKREQMEKKRNLWVLMAIMFAPLFSLASHMGYILMAWMTEPPRTTAIFLVGLVSFLYMLSLFRQCYTIHEDAEGLFDTNHHHHHHHSWGNVITRAITWGRFYFLNPLASPLVLLSHLFNLLHLVGTVCRRRDSIPYNDLNGESPSYNDFRYKAFFLSCSWGWLVAGSLGFILYALFGSLPITVSSYQLTETLETTVQIVIVVFGFMLTYIMLTVERESDMTRFLRALARKYRETRRRGSEALGDDVEAGGAIAGELAHVVVCHLDPTVFSSETALADMSQPVVDT